MQEMWQRGERKYESANAANYKTRGQKDACITVENVDDSENDENHKPPDPY